MSTKSGIVASSRLLDTFRTLDAPLVIRVSEDNTELVEDGDAPELGAELADSFAQLNRYIGDTFPRPAYVVVPHQQSFGFISFIPDSAPVREKMLYASTKNTLMTQLGTSNFQNKYTFAWTEQDEVTHTNFVQGNVLEAVLSLDERHVHDLANIQTLDRGRMVSMDKPAGGMLLFKVSPLLEEVFLKLQEQKLVVFDIDVPQEIVNLVECSNLVSTSSLVSHLDSLVSKDPHPFYAVYRYTDGKYAFIYCCPSGSKVKERMVYASNKQGLVSHLKQQVSIDKVIDAGDVDEIDVGVLLENEGKVEEVKRISRPKGPRRR